MKKIARPTILALLALVYFLGPHLKFCDETLLYAQTSQSFQPDQFSFGKLEARLVSGSDWLKDWAVELSHFQSGLSAESYKPIATTSDVTSGKNFPSVELRFGEGGSLKQSAFLLASEGQGAPILGLTDIPIQAWDVSAKPPRQLHLGFYDKNTNGAWDPDTNLEEMLHILNSTYEASARDAGSVAEVLYTARLGFPGATASDIKASVIRIEPRRTIQNDNASPSISSLALSPFAAQEAALDVTAINAFPNPIYGRDLVHDVDRITFYPLPRRAIVRIFTLDGTLVKTIQKDDDSPRISWALENDHGALVASGIYIAHVELPTLGKSKTLRLMVFPE